MSKIMAKGINYGEDIDSTAPILKNTQENMKYAFHMIRDSQKSMNFDLEATILYTIYQT
jgi:uncharacterized protein YoaH (UPF0181 family)